MSATRDRVLRAAAVAVPVAVAAVLIALFLRDTVLAPSDGAAGVDVRDIVAGSLTGDGSTAFFAIDRGLPVAWSSCQPIRWSAVLDEAPPGASELLDEAFRRVADATGLAFERVPSTGEDLSVDRSSVTIDERGDLAWSPVLVGWVDPATTDLPMDLTDRGVAVPLSDVGADGRVLVTGLVAFNAAWPLEVDFGDRHTSWGATVLHELAHLVGLDHVGDPAELMTPTAGFGAAEWGPGDLAGLRAVGASQPCRALPAPRAIPLDDFLP